MGVDHRGLHALVPQELLHRPDVVASHQRWVAKEWRKV
jgi:hypothetical protein